jgi:hypothetical protein
MSQAQAAVETVRDNLNRAAYGRPFSPAAEGEDFVLGFDPGTEEGDRVCVTLAAVTPAGAVFLSELAGEGFFDTVRWA